MIVDQWSPVNSLTPVCTHDEPRSNARNWHQSIVKFDRRVVVEVAQDITRMRTRARRNHMSLDGEYPRPARRYMPTPLPRDSE